MLKEKPLAGSEKVIQALGVNLVKDYLILIRSLNQLNKFFAVHCSFYGFPADKVGETYNVLSHLILLVE